MTISHPPGGRLPLLSARPAVTFPAAEHHRPLAGTAWRQRHIGVNNLPKVVMQLLPRVGFEPTTCWSQVQRSTRCDTEPPDCMDSQCNCCRELKQVSHRLNIFPVAQATASDHRREQNCGLPEQNQMRSRCRKTARWSVPWVLEWKRT